MSNSEIDTKRPEQRAADDGSRLSSEVFELARAGQGENKTVSVPLLKAGEERDEAGKVPISKLAANDAKARLFNEALKSMGRVVADGDVTDPDDDFYGSGFFLDKDGLFFTGYHVIELDDDKRVTVTTNDGVTHKARVVASDEKNDLALLQVEKKSRKEEFSAVKLAPFDETKKGQEFLGCGYGEDVELHCSPGVFDQVVKQKDIKLKDSAPYFDPERTLAHLTQHTEKGDSGGLEFSIEDGTVKLLIDMTDNLKHTLAIPAQRLIELKEKYSTQIASERASIPTS